MKRRRLRVFWSLAALCVLAYLPSLAAALAGSFPFTEDAPGLFSPWREFSRASLRQGTLPLIDPHLFCGLPFLSNGQTSVLYPPNVLYWFLPVRPAFVFDALLHNLWLALGAYWLGRALGLSRTSSWITAVVLGLGGAVSSHANTGHMTWHAARSYLPWELATLLLYLRSGQRRYAIGLAVLFALQMTSGYPPFVLLGVGLCCGLLIAWIVTRKRRRSDHQSHIMPRGWPGAVLRTVLLAAALSAIIVLPLREVSGLTDHGAGLPYRVVTTISGNWRTLSRLALPSFFGGNRDVQWSNEYGAHEEAAYLGLLPLVLALGAPLFARRREGNLRLPSAVLWLWALLPLSAILAMGDNTPLYRWLYDHCVLFRLTRVPVRWLEVWYLAAALLAGFSFDNIIHRRRSGMSDDGVSQSGREPVRALVLALWALFAIFLLLLIFVLMTPPRASLWMETAQWNVWVRSGEPERSFAQRLERAEELRSAAVMQSLLACVLANVLALIVTKWRIAATPRGRKRVELLLALALTADVMILFWRSSRPVTQQQVENYLAWPPSLVRAYRSGERWDTGVPWVTLNSALPLHIDLFNGYDALGGRRYYDFVYAVEKRKRWIDCYQPEHRNSLLRVAGVTHTLSVIQHPIGPVSQHDPAIQFDTVAHSGKWKLWRHRYRVQYPRLRDVSPAAQWESAWPRVYVTRRVQPVAELQQIAALQRLSLQPFESTGRPAVAAPGAFADVVATPLTAQDGVLDWERELSLMRTAVTATAPSLLVQSETLYPGWRAWVNGRPARLEPVNYLFRGVRVPAGESRVQVVYDNQTYRFAAFVSLCGLAALMALGAQRVSRRSPRVAEQTEDGTGADQPGGVEPQR